MINQKIVKRKLILFLIFIIGFALFALLVHYVHRGGGDDANFPILIKKYNLLGWLKYRYDTWSGRLASETYCYIFGYLPLYFWKISNLIHYGILTFFLYKYYELFNKHRNNKRDYIMAVFCIILPFGMNFGALCDGAFWVTGAMNYLWITAAGIASFYPILYYSINKQYPHLFFRIIALFFGFVAGSSQEQVGTTLLVFCILFLIYIFFICRKKSLFLIIETIVVFFSFLLNYFSPGNSLRFTNEVKARIPDFLTILPYQRLEYSYRWIMDALINHMGILLILTWILLIILLVNKSKKKIIDLISMVILIVAILSIAVKSNISQFFNFQAKWGILTFSKTSYIAMAFWSFILIFTIIAAYSLYNFKIKGLAVVLLILAAYASTSLMIFSPTMYESGCRTMFVPSIILCIAILLLINDCITKYKKYALLLVLISLGFPIYQYFKFAKIFSTAFNFHYPW
ncbi:hypothetical protein CPAST_c17350 [Clostridium pasteurianum DSM 525 = ATCC 6013]|uniref:Uncharacterized protein n=1 Tax=Clostridium pasteurianum DSM 525 = ATCC 6013 TaxID=1262449 RepID=A0A0H3J9K0_CLOPA|nr:DUF6056 family protein [Clostridium pasteurianum]AJA47805.1 hypothetical protein CPAST_c17350 [Clostridium pasteurianum DSM 525 = ATCC 6013]AJA51793.1 hypothetical protein CLPA_c17350 [Clostridium pasteurianum DSM 525 = ATCC 6013]AOZ75097.1 hypothetical protein AQ983_08400 [Clostridium pasteurianum DSM 525 = ATCC 6013]AOZ78892.1 hypothetical protein AQ984_08390 [Clostridium pasteurianum]ELP59706.1 hypothetical protein F502_07573 [Clostridium pasteurianum DSM 525 = ATCC 6013]